MTNRYTIKELKASINLFIKNNGRMPNASDMRKKYGYISSGSYLKIYKSWNNALINLGFKIKQTANKLTGDEKCDCCGSKIETKWITKNNIRVCSKCSANNRDFVHGILNPYSTTGIGYISEYIIHKSIENNIWLNNTIDTFNSDYDMYHENYGYINVKSSSLNVMNRINHSSWPFCINNANKIPDTYIFIAFNENKSKIEHVWIIPANETIVYKQTLRITNSEKGLKRVKQYEVDTAPYNKILQNLNIYDLFPFRNLNKSEEVSV